uniref:Uncharacterized protein n=1 Tax=Oryza meridionalis TaxID=40149 RepID=A0A0E0DIG1_9ORYZ
MRPRLLACRARARGGGGPAQRGEASSATGRRGGQDEAAGPFAGAPAREAERERRRWRWLRLAAQIGGERDGERGEEREREGEK